MTTGRQGYGRVIAADPLEERLAALESAVSRLSATARKYNVQSFPSVANAFSTVPAGATLYFPAGSYTAPTAAGWVRLLPITIEGDGDGTALRPYFDPTLDAGVAIGTRNSTVLTFGDSLTAAFGNILVRNLTIISSTVPTLNTGTGDGIRFVTPLSGKYATVDIQGVIVSGMGHDGLHFDPSSASSVDLLTLTGVRIYGSRNRGVYMTYVAAPAFIGCYINGSQGDGVFLDTGCGAARFFGSYWESNWAAASGADATFSAQMRAKLSHAISFRGCSFENWNSAGGGTALTALVLENCSGAMVDGCHFINANLVTNTRAINAISGTTVTVGDNLYQKVDIAVDTSTSDSTALVGSGGIISYDGTSGRARVLATQPDRTTAALRPHGRVELFGAEVNVTGRTTNIATANLVTGNTFTAGLYRCTVYLQITTTAVVPTVQVTIGWTATNGAKTAVVPAAALSFATLAQATATVEMEVAVSTNITYAATITGAIGTGVYALAIRLEAI